MKEGGRTESERDFEAGRKRPEAKEWRQPLEAGKGKETESFPESPKTSSALPNPNFSSVTSALDFQRTVRF